MFDLKKIVKKIQEHWITSLIALILLAVSFLDQVILQIVFKKTVILPFFVNAFNKYIPNISVEVNLRLLILSYLTVFIFPLLIFVILKKKNFKKIFVKFNGQKEIVRFSEYKENSKEDAYGEVLCGKCTILYKPNDFPAYFATQYFCECCHKSYTIPDYKRIIATARSKWIKSIF
ncbi:MAG: hypothetical protein KJ983_02170 [Candidatus Omnitrophica bacterium]|nr:hypothetical protein [Candidatus Omnitrophota bacterium]